MTETVYFGTYTQRRSQGIYTATWQTNIGQLTEINLLTEAANPTYLLISEAGNLYTSYKEGNTGGILALTPQGDLISQISQDNFSLCHLAIDHRRQLLYGASYHQGMVVVYRIMPDGSLVLADQIKRKGAGPHPHQEQSHAHFVGLTPDKYLVTCDLGTDSVTTYAVSAEGQLKQIANYQSQAGAGSRHLVFHPNEKIAYLLCELNARVEVLVYDGCGYFERLQTVSTLPPSFQGFNACAAIRLSQDGRFLYTSNRGHDSLAVFRVRKDGQLEYLETVKTNAKCPRDFTISPDQNHLIVAHQDSDNVTIFKRHDQTGKLSLLSTDVIIPEAVCVTFKADT
ncbi:6-phosphogluconolactonase [Streptococcus canis]|uniref:6-phosphogluconolactonase n=1 Tax=Streptococcus canis TaxID=1329 RepID=A0A3P5XRE6_STRCB|nr:lactonase family protein [Streptococcus canis]VDC43283.1 6-phosphogluconolactonase [Streptococcus canis]